MTAMMENATAAAKMTPDLQLAVISTLCVTSLLTLIGNILTAVVITFFIKTSSVPKALILSLCLSDVIFVVGPVALSIYSYFLPGFGLTADPILCDIDAWFVVFLRNLATLIITVMSADRLVHIVSPTWYKQKWNGAALTTVTCLCVLLSAASASLPLFGYGSYTPVPYLSDMYCLFHPDSYYTLGQIVAYGVQAFLCMSFAAVSLCLMKSFTPNPYSVVIKNRNVGTTVLTSLIARARETKQITYSLITVIVLFQAASFPFWVMSSLDFVEVKYQDFIKLITIQLPVISGLLNPLIYVIMWEQCRLGYMEMFEEMKYSCAVCCRREASFHRGLHYDTDTGTTRSDRARLRRSLSESSLDLHGSNNSLGVAQFRPIELGPDELLMFEANQYRKSLMGKTNFRKSRRQEEDNLAPPKPRIVSKSESDILEHPLPRAQKPHNMFQFQSILDLIDELTEASKMEEQARESKVRVRKRPDFRPWTSEPILDTNNEETAETGHVAIEIPDELVGYPAPENAAERKVKRSRLMCLGTSECYEVRDSDKYVNYLYKEDTIRPRPPHMEPVVFY